MNQSLENKSAFVTGGGQGIGRGIVKQLAAQGAGVTIAEINPQAGYATATALQAAGCEVIFAQVDVISEQNIQAAVVQHISHFGKLDILVNNAGRNQHFDASQMSIEDWETSMNLNLRGAWLCSKHVLPCMAQQESGVIINIASVHANMTLPNNFPYNVAKSGILGLTRSMAVDWGHKNIRVIAVSPGYIRTQPVINGFQKAQDPEAEEQRIKELHPLKRIGTPEDVGALVAYLVSDAAQYITGTEIVIDGGISARYAD